MGLSWTIVFTILVISFIICPGLVFLTHLFSRGSQSWLVEPCEPSHGFFNRLHLAVFSLHRHLLFIFLSFPFIRNIMAVSDLNLFQDLFNTDALD